MAVVAPFRGVRYNPDKIKHLEDVVTPPYDVISADAGAELQEKNPYSMINLDLRNTSQDDMKDDGRYHRARSRFDAWQDDAVLIRDKQLSMYLYYITYTHPSGKQMTRKGLVALVGLAEFSDGIVKPHEKTFPGVISDRLELMEECQAQFSQIFSLYSDPDRIVITALEKKREDVPICRVEDNNKNIHTLWRITDQDALTSVFRFFEDKSVYIADGHHRYTTALDCRRRALALNPDLSVDSPYNYVMMYLCASEDAGLSVLPTHRLVKWPGSMSADQLVDRMGDGMQISEVKTGSRETLIAEVINRMDEAEIDTGMPAFGVYHAGEDRAFLLRIRDKTVESTGSLADKPQVLRELDVVVLSELLIHDYLKLTHKQCVKENLVSYFSDSAQALDVAVKQSVLESGYTPLLFLLNPTRVDQVTGVADSGEIMPHKSTYFYPKIMTGLLINKLVSDEKIILPGRDGRKTNAPD
ncbi:MAG: DUF1015 domain-containing protein [Desulfocapsa sp.]|nr:MAG: DUF1015 domain-containing protein [Desulfocapsa sp.]